MDFIKITNLRPVEVEVLKQRLYSPKTLEKIGSSLEVSRERVRQILRKAINQIQRKTIRLYNENQKLKSLLEEKFKSQEENLSKWTQKDYLDNFDLIPKRIDRELVISNHAFKSLMRAGYFSMYQLTDEFVYNLKPCFVKHAGIRTVEEIQNSYKAYKNKEES